MVAQQQIIQKPTPAPLTVQEQTGKVEVIERLAVEWRALCAEGRCAQPFLQPEWIAAYVRAFAADKTLIVFTVRRAGRLRAVLPLVAEFATLHGVPVRKLRSPSNVHSCRFDLIVGNNDGEEAVHAIWQALQQKRAWDVIELLDVPEGGAGETLLRFAKVQGHNVGQWERPPSSYLTLPAADQLEETLQTLISNRLRKLLRYCRRNLEGQGALQFRCIAGNELQNLERFYYLESAGWKGKEGTAISCDPQTKQFYDEIARASAQAGYFSLYSLELNEHPIAMQYGLAYGGCLHLLKPAYDERFSEYSPGHLLTYEVLRDIVARGFQEYDFMSPPSEWKNRWAKALRAQSHCYIFRPDLIGQALHTWKFRLLHQARQVKRRWVA